MVAAPGPTVAFVQPARADLAAGTQSECV